MWYVFQQPTGCHLIDRGGVVPRFNSGVLGHGRQEERKLTSACYPQQPAREWREVISTLQSFHRSNNAWDMPVSAGRSLD